MSTSILRVDYHNVYGVGGMEDAEFIRDNFNLSEDSNTYYISEETLKDLKKQKGRTKEEKQLLKALTDEVKKHGEFDVSIF